MHLIPSFTRAPRCLRKGLYQRNRAPASVRSLQACTVFAVHNRNVGCVWPRNTNGLGINIDQVLPCVWGLTALLETIKVLQYYFIDGLHMTCHIWWKPKYTRAHALRTTLSQWQPCMRTLFIKDGGVQYVRSQIVFWALWMSSRVSGGNIESWW